MKKYKVSIAFDGHSEVIVEADSEKEAIELVKQGEFDDAQYHEQLWAENTIVEDAVVIDEY